MKARGACVHKHGRSPTTPEYLCWNLKEQCLFSFMLVAHLLSCIPSIAFTPHARTTFRLSHVFHVCHAHDLRLNLLHPFIRLSFFFFFLLPCSRSCFARERSSFEFQFFANV